MTDRSLKLYNTLSGTIEPFESLKEGQVKMYNCGPTVYDYQHIGNLSNPVFVDVLRRTLERRGYTVQQTMNFTDFGHLTSDADDGEDKMTIGLKREGLEPTLENMKTLAEKYASAFLDDIAKLRVETDSTEFPRASEFVPAQIALIETLEQKGYTYTISDGVYFDTEHFPRYGALGNQSDSQQEEGARVTPHPEKRNPRDFALWKFSDGIGWKSPWGIGFPGWHIECSAMAYSTLGKQIDIHTGGIEHIGVHHNNEIAQSEAATGKAPFSRFWLHRAHIQIEGRKISKSLGNTIFLRQIVDRGFSPLSFRYWLLTAHYRTPSNFTWDALEASHTALKKLHRHFVDELSVDPGTPDSSYTERFDAFLDDDLDTPKAIALLWEVVKDTTLTPNNKRATLLVFDSVLGLGLSESDDSLTVLRRGGGQRIAVSDIPKDVQTLVTEREAAREARDFERADALRADIATHGFVVTDTDDGPRIEKQS